MICLWCRDQAHRMCRGGTWCDCAHRVSAGEVYDATVTAAADYRRVMMLDPDTPVDVQLAPGCLLVPAELAGLAEQLAERHILVEGDKLYRDPP